MFTVWPFPENVCHSCLRACVLSHRTNLLFLNSHIRLVTTSCQFVLKNVSDVALYLHCNCLSSGSCELCLGDKISCSVSSLPPSQALDSFCTDASHPFPHHSTCRKGSICTRHWSKWTWLLGGWRWLAQSNPVFLKSNSIYKRAHWHTHDAFSLAHQWGELFFALLPE